MDESTALIRQALADRAAAERFVTDENGTGRCHAIAKWQQAVEKAIKAIVLALREAGILNASVQPRHQVTRYVDMLVRLPRAASHRSIQSLSHGLLDQDTRTRIRGLDSLAPQYTRDETPSIPLRTPRDSGPTRRPKVYSRIKKSRSFGPWLMTCWTEPRGSFSRSVEDRGESRSPSPARPATGTQLARKARPSSERRRWRSPSR